MNVHYFRVVWAVLARLPRFGTSLAEVGALRNRADPGFIPAKHRTHDFARTLVLHEASAETA